MSNDRDTDAQHIREMYGRDYRNDPEPAPCTECNGTGVREITIGGDGYGDRCGAEADVETVCWACQGTGVEPVELD